jgi:nicotinamide-nucleotide amidase
VKRREQMNVYTPRQKFMSLRIPPVLIQRHGTVSRDIAVAMAEGALQASTADIAVSVTGVAGPDPDNPSVYFGCARRGALSSYEMREFGMRGRSAIRYAAAAEALAIMESCADGYP